MGQVCELSTQVWEIEEPFIAPHLLEDAGIENLFERLAWTREALRVGQQGSSECGRPQHPLPKSTELRTLGALITMDISWLLLWLILENRI